MNRVFVTGGSRGIGAATVQCFASKGHEVVFTYNSNLAEAQKVVQACEGRAKAIQMDLVDVTSIRNAMEQIVSLDCSIVVHNAAFTRDGPFYFMEEDAWNSVIGACLNSFFHINKALLGSMVQRKFGRIISVVSISGEAGNRGQSNYAAAKGALIAASKSLAREMASKNILVNCVSPGIIETDMTTELPLQQIKEMIPMRRLGLPHEIAKVIGFLASEDASYITGEVIRVNGGFYT